MRIQASDIAVNATQVFDVVFSEIYRARGGTRSHGRDGGFTAAKALENLNFFGGPSAVFVGQIRGYVAQSDQDRIPDFLEGRANDGATFVYRRSTVEQKGGSTVATYRVTMNLPAAGPLRRIAAALKKNRVESRLIKVPPKVEQQIVDRLFFETLWRMRDKFTVNTRAQFKDLWTALQAQIRVHAPKIPNHRAGTMGQNSDADLTTFWVPFSTDGLPANYQHLVPRQNRIRVGFNWTGKFGSNSPTIAYWWGTKNTLMVNMFNVEEFMRFPAPNWGPSIVSDVLKNVEEAVQHELRHAVQDLLLEAVDPKQTVIRPDYHQHGDGYYSSPIEFDPQIGSLAFEFVEYWKVHLEHGRRTSDRDRLFMMKQFVGAVPPRNMGMRVHPFFDALKRKDVGAWRAAVKKFYVEVDEALKKGTPVQSAVKRKFRDLPRDPMGFPIFLQMRDSKSKRYGAPVKEFFLTPDDVKMMKWDLDHDGFARAARRIYGDHNDFSTSLFGQGFWLGYQQTVDPDDFKFSKFDRDEMVNEYLSADQDAAYANGEVDDAEGVYQDAMRCGSALRSSHEHYLQFGEWDAPHSYTNFFSFYKPEN